MRRPLSAYSKALVAGAASAAGAIVATFPDSPVGKWAAVLLALFAALGLTAATRNTVTVTTGPGEEPVTIGQVVDDTGSTVGAVVASTGAAAGGVLAGTTGVLGHVLDSTLGKLIPRGDHRGDDR